MNYYDARPLADRSGFHFTARNDDRIFPVGYCASQHPDTGHATPEEARECFRRYVLDGQREETYGDWTGCEFEGCDTPTKKGMTTRPPLGNGHALCDEHRTPEILEQLTPPVGQIIASD